MKREIRLAVNDEQIHHLLVLLDTSIRHLETRTGREYKKMLQDAQNLRSQLQTQQQHIKDTPVVV